MMTTDNLNKLGWGGLTASIRLLRLLKENKMTATASSIILYSDTCRLGMDDGGDAFIQCSKKCGWDDVRIVRATINATDVLAMLLKCHDCGNEDDEYAFRPRRGCDACAGVRECIVPADGRTNVGMSHYGSIECDRCGKPECRYNRDGYDSWYDAYCPACFVMHWHLVRKHEVEIKAFGAHLHGKNRDAEWHHSEACIFAGCNKKIKKRRGGASK